MAYVYDPINNTLIDDEDKSLGNKLAVLDSDLEKAIQELNERFGPGTVQQGTQGIPQPPIKTPQAIFEFEERMKGRMADGGRIGFDKGGTGNVEGLRTYLRNLPRGAEVNIKELSEKFKVSRSTVSINRTNLRPDTKVAFNLPGTKGSGALQEGILKAYEELGKGKNTTTIDIYNKIKDLDTFKNYNRRELLVMIGTRLRMNKKPFKRTIGATSEAAEETKKIKRDIYLRKKVTQPSIVYKQSKPGGVAEVMDVKFPEKGNRTKAKFKKVIEDYYSIPKDDAKIKAAKNKIIKDFFPDGITNPNWDKLVNFFTADEGIDTKRPYKYGGDKGESQLKSREDRKSRKTIFSDKIFEDRIADEKRNIIKDKRLLKNPNFKYGYEPIDLAHRLSLASSERFNIPQRTGTIGLDRPVVNQVFVEYYQSKLNKVYNLQKELIENRPKNFRKRLEVANELITSIVNDADNRIVGVTIDEKTLKPRLYGDKFAAKYAIDQGLFDTDIKKLKPQDKEFIKNFLVKEQVMREVDTGLDVKNFRNINKDSITKWMNKTDRFKNSELKKQALKILEDNPQITKPQGDLGTKDTQPQIKKLLEKKYNSILTNRINSGIPIDTILSTIADDLNIPTEQVKNVAGKTLRGFGKAATVLDPMFAAADASKAFTEGVSGKEATNYVVARFFEGIANLPALAKGGFDFAVDKAMGKDAKFEMPYEATFAQDYLKNVLEQTPKEVLEARKAQLEFDQNVLPGMTMVDDIDIPASKAEIEAARDRFMDEKGVDLSVLDEPKPDKTFNQFLANGGRAGFSNGGAAGADDNFLKELEFYFTNEDAELPKMQTYKETMNPIEVLNDIIDPRNYPYYADILTRSGLRIGEFGVRILPAVGKLVADTIQKGPFKITGSGKNNYVQDYTDTLPSNIKGTGIFSEFLENITPTTLEKKVGLDKLIKTEEQKQIERGSTVGPKVFADTLGLGAEVTAPIFPGLKLLRAYAANRNLPVNDVTQKLLIKEIDEVLEQRGMNRREFLQATGAGATLILAKMLGFGDELARTTKVAQKVAEKATGGVPPYFFKLVEKIKKNGKQLEPEFDPRVENNMQFEDFVMKENMATGEITIQKIKETGVYTGDDIVEGVVSDELITYRPGENVLGKDGKFYRTADEYEESTVKPDSEGKMKDYEEGLDSIEEIIELLPNKLKMSELEAAGYNVDAFPDNIKQLLINDIKKID